MAESPLVDVPQRPVLVLDADQASALAVVRALGRQALAVHVASDAAAPIAGFSRHVGQRLRYPDPLRSEPAFVDWLAKCLRSEVYGLVIPVTERTVVPILRNRSRFDDRRIAIAPSEALEQVLDKERTLSLARRLGIPVPRSVFVDAIEQVLAAEGVLGFPLVVKPSRSVGQGSTERVQLSVSYAFNRHELVAQASHALRYGAVILQEFFRGEGVGIELIADHGKVCHAFQHRRLHEVPLTGGGSSLRISEPVVPALLAAAEQLVQALGWHGVAMVEFKYAPVTGEFRLMEINGRFWGSLPLAVAAGADFPGMLVELMTTGRVSARPPARNGVVCRQLARDLDWLEHVLRRAAPAQLVRLPSAASVVRDTLLVLSPRHHFDVQSFRDLRPGLVDLWRIASKLGQRLASVLDTRRRLNIERRRGRDGGPARRALGQARQVLFLCYGNINRSALGHAYAQARHSGRFDFRSAGFHAPGGRPADPVMVEVAAREGIDLSDWQSCSLTDQMVQEADVIFAMELAHLDRLWAGHPEARDKSFLLGASIATSHRDVEVADPYGTAASNYTRIHRQVTGAVDGWFPAGPGRPTQGSP